MPPTGGPERILREGELFLRTLYNHEGPGHLRDDKLESIHKLDQAFQLLDCEGYFPSPKSRAQSATAVVNPEIESDLYICKFIWNTVAQNVIRDYSRRSLQAPQKVVETAHLDLFIASSAKEKSGLENAPYKFIETVLTDTAGKEVLNEIFDLSIDR